MTASEVVGYVGNYREGGFLALSLADLLSGELGPHLVDALGEPAALHARKVALYVQLSMLETGMSFEEIVDAVSDHSQSSEKA